ASLATVPAQCAEFAWRHARRLAAQNGRDDTSETEIARVPEGLLARAQAGPADKATSRVTARTRAAAAAHRPPPREEATPMNSNSGGADDGRPPAPVSPFGIFDADAEAARR